MHDKRRYIMTKDHIYIYINNVNTHTHGHATHAALPPAHSLSAASSVPWQDQAPKVQISHVDVSHVSHVLHFSLSNLSSVQCS